jgi:hypothetical protein
LLRTFWCKVASSQNTPKNAPQNVRVSKALCLQTNQGVDLKIFISIILILFSSYSLAINENITIGSGKFTIEGGQGHTEKHIDVYYHLPLSYDENTKVLVVVPGAGRNGWSYRDSWVEASEKYNVLILSPSYSEEFYPRFWNYNVARMLSNVKINKAKSAIESYTVVTDPNEWIFIDFDRVFNYSVSKLSLTAKKYDMFGHSAGGQILHRLALFDFKNKANRILASNSGWYTVPTFKEDFPYGLNKGVSTLEKMSSAFKTKLTIFLGEQDNEHETRGHLVRNPQLDIQGTYRLSRGKHFFKKSNELASNLNVKSNWNIHVVQGVGHDYKNMGKAAAIYLYSE